jgi:hypothetical protein
MVITMSSPVYGMARGLDGNMQKYARKGNVTG